VHFVYSVVTTEDARRGIYIGSTAAPPDDHPVRLFSSSSGAVYVPSPGSSPGVLLSAEGRWIEARRFDPSRLTVVGDVKRMAMAAAGASPHHAALLDASSNLLAFSSMSVPYGAHIAVMNRHDGHLEMWPEQELGHFLRLSPNQEKLARVRVDPLRGDPDIWVTDLKRGGQLRISTTRDLDVLPAWSPDGERIAYRSGTNAAPTVKVASADGTGTIRTFACPQPYCEPTDWTPNGAALVVNVSGGDVWTMPVDGSAPRRLLHERFMERDARVSPNGRWITYVSEESGRAEVSVRSLTGTERRFAVSTNGGDQPVWGRDGRELFYVNPGGFLQAVSVREISVGGLQFGRPELLQVPQFAERHWGTTYDVSTDGRVYFPYPGNEPFPQAIAVIFDWQGLIK